MRHQIMCRKRGRGTQVACRAGFSLVELLVVMSIIVLLVAISLPSMRRSIRQARATMCQSALKEVYLALETYRADNNEWLPLTTGADAYRSTKTWWAQLVEPNPGIKGVLICPDDPWAPVLRDQIAHGRFGTDGPGSYGLNDFIVSSPSSFLANLGRYSPRRPHDTMLVADLGPDGLATSGEAIRPPMRNLGRLAIDDMYRPGETPENREDSWLTGRHLGFINALTVLGNVRSIPTQAVMRRPLSTYYDACAAGDCTMCRYLDIPHYSFTEGHTYWWTGPEPRP